MDVSAPPAPAIPYAVAGVLDPDQRIHELQVACAAAPADAEPRIALAQALLAASRAAEALFPSEQAVALAPGLSAATAMRDAVVAAPPPSGRETRSVT